MSLTSLEPDFAAVMQSIIDKTSAATGLKWIATSCRRTMHEQEQIYAQGRTKPGEIVTKAKAGESAHNFGLACDCAPLNGHGEIWWNAPAGYWETYGAECENAGMNWGGHFRSFTDLPHCESPRWKEQQALWRDGKIHVS
jgi:peptidoglycan L-alanyl-D-glutamate endopeptidase CwlK